MITAAVWALFMDAKAASISAGLCAVCDDSWKPNRGERRSISFCAAALDRFVGFQMTPTRDARGDVSLTSSSHFALNTVS